MRAVDEDIRAAALSAGRHIAVAVEIAAKSDGGYVTKQTLTSEVEYIKITAGGDSDGAAIGKTYCAKLVLKIPRYIDIAESDRLIVRVGYDTGAETSTGKMPLGWFYVDNIAINGYVATITAFDKMLRGSKNYISTLDYPAVLPNVLDEVCAKMGLSLDSSVTVPEYTINTPPIRGKDKDGNTLYYSKRQMLGFIGSLMGGNWYIDAGGHLSLAKLADAVDTALAANVFESDINSDVFTVTGIAWNTGSQTYKRQDVDARGVIEFYNPLDVTHEPILAALEMALVGKSYYGGKIKRQGAGWHEIGDIVNVPIDKNGNTKPILLTGIERIIENGGYTETWQSCAQTESEANYTVDSGADVSGTSEAEYPPLSEYEYLTDLSVRYNGVTYTAEKDDTTGLISRIYDDSGNEFEPTINSGITDITMHNAVFMAVAVHGGLAWNNKSLYLYKAGDECETITGGWNGRCVAYSGTNTGSFSKETNKMVLVSNASSTSVSGVFTIVETALAVDFSGYKKLKAEVLAPSSNASIYCDFGISIAPVTDAYDNAVRVVQTGKSGEKTTIEIDITSYQGEYYVNLLADLGNTLNIYNIWLDKQ